MVDQYQVTYMEDDEETNRCRCESTPVTSSKSTLNSDC
jgi:hypothetical protein